MISHTVSFEQILLASDIGAVRASEQIIRAFSVYADMMGKLPCPCEAGSTIRAFKIGHILKLVEPLVAIQIWLLRGFEWTVRAAKSASRATSVPRHMNSEVTFLFSCVVAVWAFKWACITVPASVNKKVTCRFRSVFTIRTWKRAIFLVRSCVLLKTSWIAASVGARVASVHDCYGLRCFRWLLIIMLIRFTRSFAGAWAPFFRTGTFVFSSRAIIYARICICPPFSFQISNFNFALWIIKLGHSDSGRKQHIYFVKFITSKRLPQPTSFG